ncbi:hypothetical protein A6U92_20605 [Agrobacterium rubi]|nr:hypothetical protein A6U92_20605 [Agrobacterium rubi]
MLCLFRAVFVGVTPLCPAGHLPLKGGDRMELALCLPAIVPCSAQDAYGGARQRLLLISPLEGEMPGRAEGGISSADLHG